ncbi:MAG: hypothetical protein HQL94_03730 [Magnetococcales bacterium]|nr:hypothetical protein [Magnetococcales bacterium]
MMKVPQGCKLVLGGVFFLVGLLMAGMGEAALFCVMDSTGKHCQYSDLDSCRRAAGSKAGCVLNDAEVAKPFGGSPYCLVESWRTECVYMDMASCEKRATTTRTVCMANPNNNNAGMPGAGLGNTGMGGVGSGSPFGAQSPQAGMPARPAMPAMPNMPNMPNRAGFPNSGPTMPTSGGVASGYMPGTGYWPGIDK